MRIPKRWVLDSEANAVFALAAIPLSLFVFAYSSIFGQISILAFYACWLPVFLMAPHLLLRNGHRVLPLLLLPLAALVSTGWSDVPMTTLRAAIQYGTTIFCGLLAARLVSIPNLALGGTLGGLAVLLYSAMYGGYDYDVVDGSYAFNGVFASKNQLGFYASLTLLFAVGVLFLFRTGLLWRAVALFALALALLMLSLSDSATSLISLILAGIVIVAARLLVILPPRARHLATVGLIAFAAAGVAAAVSFGAFDAALAAFGRDPTLTGRTYLWQQGIEFGSQRPWIGLGYYAFWTHGRPEAEVLWEEFYIASRFGFNFHNALIESYVDLGLLGVTLLGGTVLALCGLAVMTLLRTRSPASSILCAGLALMFAVRAMVELDFFTPYTAGSFLVPMLILNMADRHAADRRVRRRGAAEHFSRAFRSPARADMRTTI